MKKFLIIMLVLIMSVSAIIGVTYSVKHEETKKDEDLIVKASYEQLISDLENDIASSLENVAALEAEIELNGLTISSLTSSVVSYKNQVASLESSVEKYEDDIVLKTTELEAKTGEIAKLTAQLDNSEEENAELEAQIETLTREKTTLEEEFSALNAEKLNLETIISEKNAEIVELTNSISEKSLVVETLSSQVAENQTTINSLNSQVDELISEIEAIESDIVTKDEEIENLVFEAIELKSQISNLNSHIEELNAIISDLNIRIDILENQVSNIEKDPNKMYVEDFYSKVTTFVDINKDRCLMSVGLVSTEEGFGLYVVDKSDYSCEFLSRQIIVNRAYLNEDLPSVKYYVSNNGNVLIFASDFVPEDFPFPMLNFRNWYFYNYELNTLTITDFNYEDRFAFFGNVIVYNDGLNVYYVDFDYFANEVEYRKLLTTISNENFAVKVLDNYLFIGSLNSQMFKIFNENFEELTINNLSSYSSYYYDVLGFFKLENNQVLVYVSDNSHKNSSPYEGNYGFLYLDLETMTLSDCYTYYTSFYFSKIDTITYVGDYAIIYHGKSENTNEVYSQTCFFIAKINFDGGIENIAAVDSFTILLGSRFFEYIEATNTINIWSQGEGNTGNAKTFNLGFVNVVIYGM